MITQTRTTKAEASRTARQFGLTLIAGGRPGSLTKWSNGKKTATFVPDHAYTSDGWLTIRTERSADV